MQKAEIERLERQRVRLFDLPVACLGQDEFIRLILGWAKQKDGGARTVGYLNAHTVNLLHRNEQYRRAMRDMSLLYADGMSVVKHSEQLGEPLPGRVNAGDFLPRFLWAAKVNGLRVALVGSEQATVEECAATLQRLVRGLQFCLVHHGHFAPGEAQERQLLRELKASQPDVILAGMGSPKQEYWALERSGETGAGVIWCVGALFEYYATRRRAPVWMREAGLEWLFRLMLEPKRLAGRYLWGNVEFLWRSRSEVRRRGRE